MMSKVIKNSCNALKHYGIYIWGMSILATLLIYFVELLGCTTWLITIPILVILNAGIFNMYLMAYKQDNFKSNCLFAGFKKENISRVLGGGLWHILWSLIWGFVPIANVYKHIQYSFTPYILMTRPEVEPMEAIKISKEETRGHKLQIFLSMLCIFGGAFIIVLLLLSLSGGLSLLTFNTAVNSVPRYGSSVSPVGFLGAISGFVGIIVFVAIVAIIVITPLFMNLMLAGIYEESLKEWEYLKSNPNYNTYYNNSQQYGAQDNTQFNQQNYQEHSVHQEESNQQFQTEQQPKETTEQQLIEQEPVEATEQQFVNTKPWFCRKCSCQNKSTSKFCMKCGTAK